MMPEIAKEKKTKEDVIDAFKVAAPCPFSHRNGEQCRTVVVGFATTLQRRPVGGGVR